MKRTGVLRACNERKMLSQVSAAASILASFSLSLIGPYAHAKKGLVIRAMLTRSAHLELLGERSSVTAGD
jgi:hypothetical protein